MAGAEYSIVLLGRFAGKDRAVAQALSRSFGRDDAWGLQVVGATPIVLLAGLNIDQSSAVADALADVEQAGSRLEIQQGVDEGLPKLQWPATPRIRGHLITEFGPGGPKPGPSHTMQLIVPCPYTNQKIQLTLNMTFGRAADGSVIPNVSATTAPYAPSPMQQIPMPMGMPAPIPSPRPTTPAAPRHIIALPAPIPLPGVNPPSQNAKLTPASGVPMQPPNPKPTFIEGLDALDELSPMDQIPTPTNLMVPASKGPRQSGPSIRPQTPAANTPPQLPPPQPLPQPIRPPGPPPPPPNNMAKPLTVSFGVKPPAQQAPLPDVPVLHTPPKPAAPANPSPISPMSNNGMPMPSTFNAPMDLSEFEANVTGSGLVAALQEENQSAVGDNSTVDDDGSVYSVFIGKTNNPKAHEIVADVVGISAAEASRMCQKPIVSLAKDVSLAKAQDIKNRFASANIQVRLNKKR